MYNKLAMTSSFEQNMIACVATPHSQARLCKNYRLLLMKLGIWDCHNLFYCKQSIYSILPLTATCFSPPKRQNMGGMEAKGRVREYQVTLLHPLEYLPVKVLDLYVMFY